jgi:GNAT superfamily N-acetyltransferase
MVILSYDTTMRQFLEIGDPEDAKFAQAMDIYSRAFPQSERHPVEVIKERVCQGLNELFVATIENEVVFMALLWPLKDTEFILLDYMATKDTHQNQGIASAFMNEMRQVLKAKSKYFIMEVENSEYGSNKEERARRISFYKRIGAKEMRDVRYVLPGLDGGTPTEMCLMVYPDYELEVLPGSIVKDLVVRIYRELYGRGTEDPLLLTFFNSIRDQVEMV